MGRKAKEPRLHDPYPDPEPPPRLPPTVAAWWAGVVKQKAGAIGPTEAYVMGMIAKFMILGEGYADRLDIESAARKNKPDFNVTAEETILRNFSTCSHNIVRLAGELGLTPKSRKQVVAAQADRKKTAAPKTNLDGLKPSSFTAGANGHTRNGKHVDR